ncbi:MAG: hypothetical protein JEZ11_28220 [Desulfobacterales bacterium]|nr:hypothetical protein [Desulfobacterales bacterium]
MTCAGVTIAIDASGAGGLDTGSVAANTWYHIWQISNGTAVTGMFSTSATSPTMPSGYTLKCRLGAVLTDGSANIIPVVQHGKTFYWEDPPLDYDDTSSTSAESLTLSVPTGVSVEAIFNVFIGGTIYTRFSSLDVDDEAPTQTAAPLADLSYYERGSRIREFTNTSGQLRVRSSGAQSRRVSTLGWTDHELQF